jgi:alpha-galactosidase/6-phospho-beta-glucosidase family protein
VEARGGPRIAFVGGGSYQWGPKIIQDVALNEELRGGTLILHDINGEALEDIYEWGTSHQREGGRGRPLYLGH